MTPQPLPGTPTLIGRVKGAMDAVDWSPDRKERTRRLKQGVWQAGFDLAREFRVAVYPFAGELGRDLDDCARKLLEERGAHFWPHPEEHSTVKGWLYDVAWVEFGGEYAFLKKDRHTADHVPNFKRLVLALESELNSRWPRWHVLTDFHKLLAARAELRVMVWDRDAIPMSEAIKLLEPRLESADGSQEGCWLLSGWGRDGFKHVEYHNGLCILDESGLDLVRADGFADAARKAVAAASDAP